MKNQLFLIYLGRFLAKVAEQLLDFAIPLIIFKTTGSMANAGLAYFIEKLPKILFFPFAGFFQERFGSKKVLIASDLIRFIFCLFIFLLVWKGKIEWIWFVPLFNAIITICNAQSLLSIETSISRNTEGKERTSAHASYQLADQAPALIGPLLATGLSFIVKNHLIISIAALIFLISSFLHGKMTLSNDGGSCGRNEGENDGVEKKKIERKKNIENILHNSQIKALICLSFCINLVLGLVLASAPGVITGHLHLPESYYGLLNVLSGVISILSVFYLKKITVKLEAKYLGGTAYLLICLGCFLISRFHSFTAFTSGFVLIIFPLGAYNIFVRQRRAELIESQDLAKSLGFILLLTQLSFPLSGIILKVLLPLLPLQKIFLAIAIINTLAFLLFMPKVLEADKSYGVKL